MLFALKDAAACLTMCASFLIQGATRNERRKRRHWESGHAGNGRPFLLKVSNTCPFFFPSHYFKQDLKAIELLLPTRKLFFVLECHDFPKEN